MANIITKRKKPLNAAIMKCNANLRTRVNLCSSTRCRSRLIDYIEIKRLSNSKAIYCINMKVLRDRSASTGPQVLSLLLESAWEHFYPYLSNDDIGKIDSALTDKSLRELYFKQVAKFYVGRSILSSAELEWILQRCIDLNVCRLEFDSDGNVVNCKLLSNI